ncbi:Uncharacterised protein [Acinetobacter calcoaceticus]|uniref:Uncharacterized protein n=1 Tax=Acinetobacter calcoaceticus TaxID=471 RepID=A0A446ZIL8_ACICA|nr:hypothetical protein [Acinetobacter calcoaceticus]VAX44329.1 Uncharacterised protein [Acinetobacter calcoaceticus]
MNAFVDMKKTEYSLVAYSNVAAKSKEREELERAVTKWLKTPSNKIKPVKPKQSESMAHGNPRAYKRMGCRCEICVTWAISSGFVKTKPKSEIKRSPDERQLRIQAQKEGLDRFARVFKEDWQLLAFEIGYAVTAFQLERVYQGKSEIDQYFTWKYVKKIADQLVAEKLKVNGGM